MSTYYVEPAMLGNGATDDDAERMVELLQAQGYDAEVGSSLRHDHEYEAVPDCVWEECLEIVNQEKLAAERAWRENYTPMFPFAYVQGGEWVND